ncbi:NAD(P)-linked oxidoreductase superfamily protein [Klebsormidium nitens]|uniref:NAD(P)-linked oxidoreductase superfamily protein n=1 Tax=Klebsormidium nitens TaxID=105231 RepID=A0A1Y1HH25_KLENI|nr:NAD(P)-linked oxidoreductase superfamily protein [Klebsormidium nitens]|eukprot:GAQ77734.1 NAD(P)-linked oxidoreductase superfamily protein [Klebsormidium nitens]
MAAVSCWSQPLALLRVQGLQQSDAPQLKHFRKGTHLSTQRQQCGACRRVDQLFGSHLASGRQDSFLGNRQLLTAASSAEHQNSANVERWNGGRAVAVLDFLQRVVPAKKPSDRVTLGPLKVSPMGIGTWAFGNRLLWGYEEEMDGELQDVFNLVVSRGINLFDTADSYGTGRLNGKSELLLGKFIREYPGSEESKANIHVASKFAPYPWRITTGQMVDACKASAKRLQMEQVSVGQLHWSTANYQPLQERVLWDGLATMYEEGLVKAVGVSNYGPKQMLKIHKYLEVRGVPLASAQVQYSLISSGGMQQEIKAVCDDLGIRLISYSPLGLGMLTGKYSAENVPKGPRGQLFRQILPGLTPLLETMRAIAAGRGKTLPQVAINWCVCKGTIPIPGAKSLVQAEENLGALGWRLTDGEIRALDDASTRIPRGMIQNIFQTK